MKVYKLWTNEELSVLEKLCRESSNWKELYEKSKNIFKDRSWNAIRFKAKEKGWIEHLSRKKSDQEKVKTKVVDDSLNLSSPEVEEQKWREPEVFEISKEAWERPGVRIGFISRIDDGGDGYRAGLIKKAMEKFAKEGTHFNVLDGGLVNKKAIKEELRTLPKKIAGEATARLFDEYARELAATIPRIKKPGPNNKGEYVRLYIMTSPYYDGFCGEEIAKRLQALRSDDIRLYKQGGDKLDVKKFQPNKIVWAINPKKARLPSNYYSTAAEREIDDKRKQTPQLPPDLWVVGGLASAIYKPGNGERSEPYITLPALHRLEETLVAENQVGVIIVEYLPNNTQFVQVWSLKDLIAEEREFVTSIKAGASETQKKIADVIKKSGAIPIGLIEDKLEIDRNIIEKEIEFLVEKKPLSRRTWPGLFYDPSSQRYDFYPVWFQKFLIYPESKVPFFEDRLLLFGCLHAGYTTIDYRFFVEKMPEIILANKVEVLVGLGDFIAGLEHSYLAAGEVFGSLNNTDQEQFAAELIGTVIIKVFEARLRELLSKSADKSPEQIEKLIDEALVQFLYIPGNHDVWQEREGNIPLTVFREKLSTLLFQEIVKIMAAKQLPAINIFNVIGRKIIGFPDWKASYPLPSGLSLAMVHPNMSRAKTTSLRAQEALDFAKKSHIVGIANFHTAMVVNRWDAEMGQRVAVQVGTLAIFTRFEQRKMKIVDFGPVFLRVLSRDGRIEMTETAYFNQPLLKEPILKGTNPAELKKKLGVISVP